MGTLFSIHFAAQAVEVQSDFQAAKPPEPKTGTDALSAQGMDSVEIAGRKKFAGVSAPGTEADYAEYVQAFQTPQIQAVMKALPANCRVEFRRELPKISEDTDTVELSTPQDLALVRERTAGRDKLVKRIYRQSAERKPSVWFEGLLKTPWAPAGDGQQSQRQPGFLESIPQFVHRVLVESHRLLS